MQTAGMLRAAWPETGWPETASPETVAFEAMGLRNVGLEDVERRRGAGHGCPRLGLSAGGWG